MANRVFLIEPTSKNLKAAEAYGHLTYIWSEKEKRPSIWEQDFETALKLKLLELKFDEYDYLLIVGSIVPIVAAMHVLSVTFPSFKVLLWHAVAQDYVCRSFKRG